MRMFTFKKNFTIKHLKIIALLVLFISMPGFLPEAFSQCTMEISRFTNYSGSYNCSY
jgi:hypothetical protein